MENSTKIKIQDTCNYIRQSGYENFSMMLQVVGKQLRIVIQPITENRCMKVEQYFNVSELEPCEEETLLTKLISQYYVSRNSGYIKIEHCFDYDVIFSGEILGDASKEYKVMVSIYKLRKM